MMMSKSVMSAGDTTFRVEQDYQEFTTAAPEADKGWRETDSHGHEHYWDSGWPTLEWVVTGTYWCEMHGEEHEEGEWRCQVCGEHIEPGMRHPGPRVMTVPTVRNYFIDDQPVDEATFKAAVAATQGGECECPEHGPSEACPVHGIRHRDSPERQQ